MQPYQEEYIANIKDIAVLTARKKPGSHTFEEYEEELLGAVKQVEQKVLRNMALLRDKLFPDLDHLLESSPQELQELEDFAGSLLNGKEEWDIGLFCQIHQALLTHARLTKDRRRMIKELYWLGIGRYNLYNKLIGLSMPLVQNYISAMRLCFTEAAAYLKYFDEIDDSETKGYILRSLANISLGRYKTTGEKVQQVRKTLQILQDDEYHGMAPELPWDRFIYMTHQQMAASISYSKECPMTPQDITDIMESVYIVYQRRLQEATDRNELPPCRPAFSYYAIEYYCGLDTLDGLLTKIEHLMDTADTADFSKDSMYTLISLPAFYCQFLKQNPEMLLKREEYVESLYQRILDYMADFPENLQDETLFLYLRQLSNTFVETKNSISYGSFLLKLLVRFAPDTYIHSYTVGKTAVALCEIILSEEPTFFDDMEEIAEIEDMDEKRQEILGLAMNCGLFHDVGQINFLYLYSQTGRQWFAEESEMSQLHTLAGAAYLSERKSTFRYAAAALGHHSWYDGSRGYPDTYQRLDCPYRQIVDIIGLTDWLEETTATISRLYKGVERSFDETVETAISLEGRRFSPLLTARLRDKEVVNKLRQALREGRSEACRKLYREYSTN